MILVSIYICMHKYTHTRVNYKSHIITVAVAVLLMHARPASRVLLGDHDSASPNGKGACAASFELGVDDAARLC